MGLNKREFLAIWTHIWACPTVSGPPGDFFALAQVFLPHSLLNERQQSKKKKQFQIPRTVAPFDFVLKIQFLHFAFANINISRICI
jgi:hypothetical protein